MKVITFTTPRLSVAMPLILGLATIAAAPTVKAVTIESVNIGNASVDVDQDGILNEATDDVLDVALWCDDAAPIQVDIRNGFVDVDEDAVVGEAADDLFNCDLNNENGGIPSRDQVDILNGCVDLNEDGVCDAADLAIDVQLFNLP